MVTADRRDRHNRPVRADDPTGRQVGNRSGRPRNHASYQPAGPGLAPRAYRPPTRTTAVHTTARPTAHREDPDLGLAEPTTTGLVAETVVVATHPTTDPTGAASAPFPVCSHRPARGAGLGW